MSQHAVEQYFKTVSFSSFDGSLQSLAQIISRCIGGYVTSRDIVEYLLNHNGLYNHDVKLCFTNGEVNITIQKNNAY